MTQEQDPRLQALFAKAGEINKGEAFTDQVMQQVDRVRRKASAGWLGIALLFAVFAWWISGPIVHATSLLLGILPASLVDINDQFVADLLAPVNSVAGVVALLFLLLRFVYKKLFR